jgi:DNA-binding CsgD family transcriptional regulator/predicted negative regulator of RcsB-dependent stress response
MVHGALGSYGTALPGARQALVIAEEIDHQQWITAVRCMLGNIYADLGAFSAASAELQAALEIARHIGSPYWIRSAAGWLASTFVHAGDLARASAVLNAEFGDETPLDTLAGRLLWCAAAEYALGAGEPDKALDMIRWLVDATPANTRQPIPRLEKIRGEALATVGRSEEAAEAFGIARAEAASIGARPLLWRIETSLGQLFRAAGFAEDARHAFTSAQTIVSELATSIPDAELRETFLTWAAGTLPKGYPRSGRDVAGARDSPLTKRELQVAALLKDGLTNREIGERLFLSEWTAATHVRNILAKLGLSSRAQIAAWAASRDGAPRA